MDRAIKTAFIPPAIRIRAAVAKRIPTAPQSCSKAGTTIVGFASRFRSMSGLSPVDRMPSRSISHEKKPACRQRAQIGPSPRYSPMRLGFREADVDPKHSIFKCGMPVIRPILSPVHSILNYAFRPVPTHFERVSFLRFVQIPPTWRSNLFKSQSTEHARILSVLSHCKPHERPNGIRPAKGSLGQRPTQPPIV